MEIRRTAVFGRWLDTLRDRRAAVRIEVRIDRMRIGNPGDVRSVGRGVSEMRIDYGPGYRVYFHRRGSEIVVLLCGGDKSTQESDIHTAHDLADQERSMPIETFPYDTAEHLKTEEDVALYIEAVLEDGDPALLRDAIGVVARARGMTQVARETGLSRESLYKALAAEGNPAFDTISRVLKALGLQLTVKSIAPAGN